MTSYCLGFAFADYDNHVVLIRKTKPAWQKGFLNGVGGKIEDGESPDMAMAREFHEETGVATMPHEWRRFTGMNFKDVEVHCFAIRLPRNNDNVKTTTEEAIGVYTVFEVRDSPKVIENLKWLIPMALHALDADDNSVPHTLDHK